MKKKGRLLLQNGMSVILIFFVIQNITAQQIVRVTDFGYEPGSHKNVIPALKKVMEKCIGNDSTVLIFPNGRYDFWQDLDSPDSPTTGIQLDNLKNLHLDGDGSQFIFHGDMQILNISGCQNIQIQNFRVDWDFPFIYQGRYVNSTDEYIDLEFDVNQYRYEIEDERFYMIGEGWKAVPTGYCDLFDRNTKEILYKSHDANNSELFKGKAEEISPGVVRFYGKPTIKPLKGTYTTLMAGRYMTTGIDLSFSKNIYFKDLTIYHALSHGVFGEKCENITMDNTSMRVNESKGRVYSIIADASHFKDCKGLIKIINCAHTGAMDDFINVQGSYLKIDSILFSKNTLFTKGELSQNDEVWFVNPEDCQRSELRTVKSIKRIGTTKSFQIEFIKDLPANVRNGDYMENETWTPAVEIRNCKILKKHRARGILVTTPKKVIIEDNYFRTAGAAILIEGDMDHWYESGACKDVTIRNNIFENCLTSGCITGDRWEWGEGIITITPSHRPKSEKSEPYHHNIRIENNTFKTFDIPLVHARSVGGLTFNNNSIVRTYAFEPYLWQQSSFLLDGCRNVKFSDNKIDEGYLTRTIQIEHMTKSDVKSDDFTILK